MDGGTAGRSRQRGNPGWQLTTHQALLRLTALGLTWSEACRLPIEEALCLLRHDELNTAVAALEHEADRVASMPFADETKQQQRLKMLELRARALMDRFYRPRARE